MAARPPFLPGAPAPTLAPGPGSPGPGLAPQLPGGPQGAPGAPPPDPGPAVPPAPPPKDIPLHSGVQEQQPSFPNVHFTTDAQRKLSPADWNALANDLYNSVNASLTAREPLNNNLKAWSDAYDLIRPGTDYPWPNASNIALPYMPAQLESLCAYIVGTVIVPRLFIVSGNTEQAAQDAMNVEKFYNAELIRLRSDGSSYFARAVDWTHMSLRDGTGILEQLWNRRRQRKRAVSYVPHTDPLTGLPLFDEEGKPRWQEQVNDVDVYVKDYPEWTPIPLKEFILIPDEARSIEDAAGVGRVEWLYEDQLDRMVRAGLLDSKEVEAALAYVPTGSSDVSSDRQGTYDKNASQQIGIGQGQGTLVSKQFKNRGPIKVWRLHTRQYDMNGDGIPEENIFWMHELSQRMLGWMPYDYATAQRPFFAFCPFPRPDSFYGYSLPERLASVASEMDLSHNARNNRLALIVDPPWAIAAGSQLNDKKGQWLPGGRIEVDDVNTFKPLPVGEIPPSVVEQEMLLKQYGNEYTGLSEAAMGMPSQGRRSAAETRQRSAATGTRLNLIAMRLRISLGQVINFTHALNKQYLRTDPQTVVDGSNLTIPLEQLAQDYTIGIAGASEPLDSQTRRNELMTLFELIATHVPMVAQSPKLVWHWMRALLEAFGRSDVYSLIGTEQDVQQMVAAQAAAQQQQALAAQHAGPGQPGAAPPGAPA